MEAQKTAVREIVDALSKILVSGGIPAGTPLVEQQLAARFGVSRTPIREVLRLLERDGLVEYIPGKGTFVTSLTKQDIEEVFMIREPLEIAAIRVSVRLIPEAEIQALEAITHPLLGQGFSEETFYEADARLHDMIVRYAGNRRLKDILSVLNTQSMRIRRVSGRLPHRFEHSINEHLAILDAIRRRDEQAAVESLRLHLEHAKESAIEACQALTAQMWEDQR